MTHVMLPCFPLKQRGQAGGFVTNLCPKKRPQRNRLVVGPSPHVRDHVHLDWNGTFLKLPETEVNLIFLDRGCLDKDTNWNEAIAVSASRKTIKSVCSNQGRDIKFVTGLLAAVLLLAGVGAVMRQC